MNDPITIRVLRGGLLESLHRVSAAVCDASGRLVAGWGDPALAIFPRSAVKPMQALPLVRSGAELTDERVAIACASHSAEPRHLDLVFAWLADLGLSQNDLECGGVPDALHNNCSGKHTGFLATALRHGEPTRGYIQPEHPVQRRVTAAMFELLDMPPAGFGVDGCGIPTFSVPLDRLAAGYARFPQADGARRILDCWRAHPFLVSGSGRLDHELMTAAPAIASKGGAEGVFAACLPDLGLGIAIKAHDGAGRAAEVALLWVLAQIGGLSPAQQAALSHRIRPPVTNVVGRVVGEITVDG